MTPKLLRTRRFGDARGWFTESYNAERLAAKGIGDTFVQDNHSYSAARSTLRGLHLQTPPHAQAKLVRCIVGAIWDVAVDVRAGSPSYGRWVAAELTAARGEQLYIPVGFAHAFFTLTENAEVLYKASDFYAPQTERVVRWDCPELAIEWPLAGKPPVLAERDSRAAGLPALRSEIAYSGVPLGDLEEIFL